MPLELKTVQELFDEHFWWEEGEDEKTAAELWPLQKRDEIIYQHFEHLRRLMWLLRNARAGTVDLLTMYGLGVWDGNTPSFVPYNLSNWAGAWTFSGTREPGELIVWFTDITGQTDLYVNALAFTQTNIISNPPVGASGMLSNSWRLTANPNKYHHWDYNAGRPEIGALGRWIVLHHPDLGISCNMLQGYTCREKAYRWMMQSVDPSFQIPPIKQGGAVTKRMSKVEFDVSHLLKWPVTHWERTRDTPTYQECVNARRLNEFVLEGGEPWRVDHPTDGKPNYVDPLLNSGLWDQVYYTCEIGTNYVWPADGEWKENFIHCNATDWSGSSVFYEYGDIVYVSDYNPGGDYPDSCFYICKKDHTSEAAKKPGVDGGEFWESPAWNPKYIKYNIEFPHMSDIVGDEISDAFPFGDFSSAEYWDCNGSVAELALRNLGEYDWYLDNSRPYVPWWIYNFQHEYAAIKYDLPVPKRCWRRFPRHIAGRPKNPETGEEYLMWPGQLGYPPGYWTDRDQVYKRLKKRFMIDQADWDAITAQGNRDDHYRVVDVQALYDQAVAEQEAIHGEGYVEGLLSIHDPIDYDSNGQPVWELHHDSVNHARYVLSQLRYVYTVFGATINGYYGSARKLGDSGPPDDLDRDTSVEAYTAARDRAMQPSNLEWGPTSNGYSAFIALHGEVAWRPIPAKWTGAGIQLSTMIGYGLVTITLFEEASEGAGRELPTFPNKGTMLFHLKYRTGYTCVYEPVPPETGRLILEHLEVGIAGKSFKPTCNPTGPQYWEYAFVGGEPSWEGWVYSDASKKWSYIMYYWITPAEPWMDEAWFANAFDATYWTWRKGTTIEMVSGALYELPGLMEIDLDGFDGSVFEEDNTNFIEV